MMSPEAIIAIYGFLGALLVGLLTVWATIVAPRMQKAPPWLQPTILLTLSFIAVFTLILLFTRQPSTTAASNSTAAPVESATVAALVTATPPTTSRKILVPTAVMLFGPEEGTLVHTGSSTVVKQNSIKVRDFIASATFTNPYSTSVAMWSYGYLFRASELDSYYTFSISSKKQWSVFKVETVSSKITSSLVDTGSVSNVNLDNNEANSVYIIVKDNLLIFYVNDVYIDTVKIEGIDITGGIMPCTGNVTNTSVKEAQTKYTGFTIWSMQSVYSKSIDGTLTHDPSDDSVEIYSPGVSLQNALVTCRFFNPYSSEEGKWDYGFIFRSTAKDDQYRFYIRNDGLWNLLLTRNDNNELRFTYLASGTTTGLATDVGASNVLTLMFKGDHVVIIVNGEIVADHTLTEKRDTGSLSIGTGMSGKEYELIGKSTTFKDLRMWPLP